MSAQRQDDRRQSPISEWRRSPGILASVTGLLLFFLIAAVFIRQDPWTSLDLSALQWLQARRSQPGIRFFSALTSLGQPPFLVFLGLAIALLLLRSRRLVLFTTWSMALIGGGLMERILKIWIRRPRPDLPEPLLHPLTFSLPSGHAMNSMIAYGMLTFILLRIWKPARALTTAIIMMAALLIAGVGFSRVYLGVHYISDVVAGFAIGVFWVGLCIALTEFHQRHRNQRRNSGKGLQE